MWHCHDFEFFVKMISAVAELGVVI